MSDHTPITNEEGDERCRNCGTVWPCRARFREERNQTQAILNDLIAELKSGGHCYIGGDQCGTWELADEAEKKLKGLQ